MPRLSIWDSGKKSADYNYLDKTISESFGIGGVACYLHCYIGPQSDVTDLNTDTQSPNYTLPTETGTTQSATAPTGVNTIQDVLLLENRDRNYSSTVYELRGIYQVQDASFDLRQFGNWINTDSIYIEFHLNDMIAQIGRKIMAGDVIELPNQRDQFLLNDAPAINKFYVVSDAAWAADGWSAVWRPHIWRCTLNVMPASQEYSDILNAQAYNPLQQAQGGPGGATLGDLISTMTTQMGINQEIWNEAVAQIPERYFESREFWIIPGTETTSQYPWVFTGDGIPPNGATLAGQGLSFPENPTTGEYYLRTDYVPPTLFMWTVSAWKFQEVDWRQTWSCAHRLLESFINNDNITTNDDGTTEPEKTALSLAVTPKADF